MKHYKYNSLTAHLMVDCFPLIRSEFRLTVSSFLSYFLKRVSNFFISYCFSLLVCLHAFVSFSNIKNSWDVTIFLICLLRKFVQE